MTEEEIWCPIKGYENIYEVSDKGRVKSLKFGKERILKLGITTDGYLMVKLLKNGEKKNLLVHRLVAQTFIPNPDNLPEVNHKDENKENNSVQNLEWCDRKYMEQEFKEWLRINQNQLFNTQNLENSLENGSLLVMLKGISDISKTTYHPVALENANQHMTSSGNSRVDKENVKGVINIQ